MRICIDTGHGGKDPGAVNGRYQEDDIGLAIALLAKQGFVRKGHKVVMTRGNDKYVDLKTRCKIANNFKADLFISIHLNSSADKQAGGTEVLYKSQKGRGVAARVQKSLVNALKTRDRGVKFRDDLWVLNGTNMTSILIEVAFISNASDLRLLLTSQKEIAGAIVDAI